MRARAVGFRAVRRLGAVKSVLRYIHLAQAGERDCLNGQSTVGAALGAGPAGVARGRRGSRGWGRNCPLKVRIFGSRSDFVWREALLAFTPRELLAPLAPLAPLLSRRSIVFFTSDWADCVDCWRDRILRTV